MLLAQRDGLLEVPGLPVLVGERREKAPRVLLESLAKLVQAGRRQDAGRWGGV
jgi:hypothetical protein